MLQTTLSAWLGRFSSTQKSSTQASAAPPTPISESTELTSSPLPPERPGQRSKTPPQTLDHPPASLVSFQQYEHDWKNANGSRSPHPQPLTTALAPQVTLSPLTEATLHAFRRLNSLLLPIPYPTSFYSDILSDPDVSSITLVATWSPSTHTPTPTQASTSIPAAPSSATKPPTPILVGGIRCRLSHDLFPPSPSLTTTTTTTSSSSNTNHPPTLYISTLGTLAPYRSHGIASALLSTVTARAAHRFHVRTVAAHVWEANAEALDWYLRRGFEIVRREEGYYRRLRPSAAFLIRKEVKIGDLLEGEGGLVEEEEGERGTGGG